MAFYCHHSYIRESNAELQLEGRPSISAKSKEMVSLALLLCRVDE